MSKLLVTWSVVAGMAMGTSMGSATPNGSGEDSAPKLEFERSAADLGDVRFDRPIQHKFDLTNSGSSTLVLKTAYKSCSCVSEILSSSLVESDGHGVLELGYAPATPPTVFGAQSFSVVLATNDKENEFVEFKVSAKLVRPFDAVPEAVDFGEVVRNDSFQMKLQLENHSSRWGRNSRIVKCSSTAKEVSITPVFSADESGGPNYLVSLSPGPLGDVIDEKIIMETSDPLQPVIEVPVRARISPEYVASPPKVRLEVPGVGEKTWVSVRLSPRKKPVVSPASYHTDVDGLAAVLVRADVDDDWWLRLEYSGSNRKTTPWGRVRVLDEAGRSLCSFPVRIMAKTDTRP